MANVQNPNGATPLTSLSGTPWSGSANIYSIPSADGTAYGVGDIVKSANGCSPDGYRNVIICATNDTPRGIIVGIFNPDVALSSIQGTSLALETIQIPTTKTKNYYVMVADDPNLVFEMQDDGGTYPGSGSVTANQQAASNYNASLTVTNVASGGVFSQTTLEATTFATTNSLIIKLLGIVVRQGNNFGSSYLRWRCTWNLHELSHGGTTGA